jgi:hypothetical protein
LHFGRGQIAGEGEVRSDADTVAANCVDPINLVLREHWGEREKKGTREKKKMKKSKKLTIRFDA